LVAQVEEIKETAVVSEKRATTTARPHNLTLVIGLLSPLLGVVALIISLMSLRTSERSLGVSETNMKVAQRGYVRIVDGKMRLTHALLPLYELGKPMPRKPDEPIGFGFSASLENLGNTPVRFTHLVAELPGEAGIHLDSIELQRDLPPELGQKVKYDWSWSIQGTGEPHVIQDLFKEFEEFTKRGRRVLIGSPMNFTFTLTYQDVFQEEHLVRWCWTPLIDGNNGMIYGEQCRADH
jgi:hypothetical protein